MPDDDFLLVVAIQTAEVHPVNAHHRHVMAALGLIVDRHDLLAVVPPLVLGVVVGRFDFQDGRAAVWELHQVVQIGQHPRVFRVLEHTFALVDLQPGLFLKDAGHQRLQQVSHLQGNPVFLVIRRHDTQLIVVEVPSGAEWGDPKYRSGVTTAKPLPAPSQPFIPRESRCIHQHQRLIR